MKSGFYNAPSFLPHVNQTEHRKGAGPCRGQAGHAGAGEAANSDGTAVLRWDPCSTPPALCCLKSLRAQFLICQGGVEMPSPSG